jgi:hypothetical protein
VKFRALAYVLGPLLHHLTGSGDLQRHAGDGPPGDTSLIQGSTWHETLDLEPTSYLIHGFLDVAVADKASVAGLVTSNAMQLEIR